MWYKFQTIFKKLILDKIILQCSKKIYSSLPLKYTTWTYAICAYLAGSCIL